MPIYFQWFITISIAFISCTESKEKIDGTFSGQVTLSTTLRGISLPKGFNYVAANDPSYADWLLSLKLKADNTVRLYNGLPKTNQNAQFRVLDINIGKKDLLQCADAVMKLRADYLFGVNKYEEMKFITTSGEELIFSDWLKGKRWKEKGANLVSFKINKEANNLNTEYNAFMDIVYSYCGTYSLAKQLNVVKDIDSIQPGDVFVQGGFPGHAVTVMAVAKNDAGQEIFLLSQGYMPAQDNHILKNDRDPVLSPWYDILDIYPLYTPEWIFKTACLKRW